MQSFQTHRCLHWRPLLLSTRPDSACSFTVFSRAATDYLAHAHWGHIRNLNTHTRVHKHQTPFTVCQHYATYIHAAYNRYTQDGCQQDWTGGDMRPSPYTRTWWRLRCTLRNPYSSADRICCLWCRCCCCCCSITANAWGYFGEAPAHTLRNV